MATPAEATSAAQQRRDESTIDAPPQRQARKLSQAEKAHIAEKTAAILAKAKPGTPEYADACALRAEIGLVVPEMKKTAVDLFAMQQFRDVVGPDARKAFAKRNYALWLVVGLGLLAVGVGAWVFLDVPPVGTPAASAARAPSSAETVAPTPLAAATVGPTALPSVTPAESATAVASSPAPSTHVVAPPPVRTALAAPPPPPKPTAAPSAMHNPWAPVWKNP